MKISECTFEQVTSSPCHSWEKAWEMWLLAISSSRRPIKRPPFSLFIKILQLQARLMASKARLLMSDHTELAKEIPGDIAAFGDTREDAGIETPPEKVHKPEAVEWERATWCSWNALWKLALAKKWCRGGGLSIQGMWQFSISPQQPLPKRLLQSQSHELKLGALTRTKKSTGGGWEYTGSKSMPFAEVLFQLKQMLLLE